MAVQSRFGVARRAAGVTHGRGRVFVKLWPGVGGRLFADPGFVTLQAGDAAVFNQFFGQRRCVAQGDEVFDAGAAAVHGFDDGQEAHVKTQHRVFGVVGDPDDLVWVQARVQRVQHFARAAHAKVQLHVSVTVPRQRGHAVAEVELQAIEGVGHLAAALGHLFVGVTVNIAFDAARNDFSVTVVALCEFDQRRDQQVLALH